MDQTMKKNQEIKNKNVVPFIPEAGFYFSKGVEAFQKKKYNIAIKWLQKAIESAPSEALYKCQMSIVYTEIGAYKNANELLLKVLDTSGEEYMDCYYLLANNYAHLGLLHDAKNYALSYLEKEPDGDFQEEAKQLLEVIDMEEEEVDDDWLEEDELLVYQEAVFQHLENREWKQAIPLLKDMLTLFPEHPLTLHDYAKALFYTGEKERAIQIELDVLKKDSTILYAHINLAVFYFAIQAIPEYEAHIQSLVNVYPIYEEQKLRVAIALAQTENYHDAYIRFQSLSKGKMKNHMSYFKWYSIVAYHIGAFEKAHALMKEGSKKHPNLQHELQTWYST